MNYIKVIVYAARLLLLNLEANHSNATMKIIIDKMSRLFFYMDGKFFSIAFPFIVEFNKDAVVSISSYTGKELNNKSISDIISILDSKEFKINNSIIDFYIEPGDINIENISLLEEMFMFEPSYIRYDHDFNNENGKLHPLNHLDFNYSQYGTFKVGLNHIIDECFFENIQNIRTDCLFLY